jgi:hypothetical protein
MTTHTNCTHPATKSARAACRKAANAQGDTTPRVTVAQARKAAEAPEASRLIKSVMWDRTTCDRCGGTAMMPFAAWGGVCLKCNQSGKGDGTIITRAGKAARDKYEAYLTANHSKMMIDLQPGDVVRDNHGKRRTVVSVDTNVQHGSTVTIGTEGNDNFHTYSSLRIIVRYLRETHHVGPFETIVVPPRGEALQAAFRHVANMKGCHVTYYEG